MESNVEEIKAKLIGAGLCEKWRSKWQDSYNLEDIAGISLTFEGVEYMRKNKGVILELLPNFQEYVNGKTVSIPDFGQGAMFINATADMGVPMDVDVVYISGSDVKMSLPEHKVAKIIIDSESIVRLKLGGNNIVFVELYYKSKLMLLKDGEDNSVNIIRDAPDCAVIPYLGKNDRIRINTK